LAAAHEWIDAHCNRLAAERLASAVALGRILGEAVTAPSDLPAADRAAADGIAVRAEDTMGASAYNPLLFPLAAAGSDLPPGGACPVAAGTALPPGADAVIPADHTSRQADGAYEVIEAVEAGAHVERRGSHAATDALLLPAGRRLRPGDLALLLTSGIAEVAAIGRPRVAVLLAGPTVPDGAPDADGPMLAGLILRDGGIVAAEHRVGRNHQALAGALAEAAARADLLLVVGGSGLGEDDHAAGALAGCGQVNIRGVAMAPGQTTTLGRAPAGRPALLLPGDPAACLWSYEMLAGRAVRRMAGSDPALPFPIRPLRLTRKIASPLGIAEIRPVRRLDAGEAEPLPGFAEGGLMAGARADGVVIVPEGSEGFAAGSVVPVHCLDDAPAFDALDEAAKDGTRSPP